MIHDRFSIPSRNSNGEPGGFVRQKGGRRDVNGFAFEGVVTVDYAVDSCRPVFRSGKGKRDVSPLALLGLQVGVVQDAVLVLVYLIDGFDVAQVEAYPLPQLRVVRVHGAPGQQELNTRFAIRRASGNPGLIDPLERQVDVVIPDELPPERTLRIGG